MKRKLLLVLGLVFVMITTLVCAVGCKKTEAHKHTWATEWSVGGETHWHACTVEGCTAKKDEGNHEGGRRIVRIKRSVRFAVTPTAK